MKKIISLIILLLLVLSMSACGAMSKSTPAEDFEYEMSNGEIIITGYKGTEREIYIPSKINDRPVTTIGEDAFENYDLTHVTIPDSVTTIGKYAFYECKCLVSVDFSNNLESIGSGAFKYCESLTEIDLPDSLKEIGKGTFYGCKLLEKVNYPKAVEKVGEGAFNKCDSLTEINFSKSLEKICEKAFCGCDSLTNISLPDTSAYIEKNSFELCSNLESLEIPYNTEIEIKIDGVDKYTDLNGKTYSMVFFYSPVEYIIGIYSYEDEAFEEISAQSNLIIYKDSKAYQQLKEECEKYELKFEISADSGILIK